MSLTSSDIAIFIVQLVPYKNSELYQICSKTHKFVFLL